ncbi:AAA family ATPase [Natronospora cellulosivora (SeqCode)]
MLIRFSVENFLSFSDKQEISMIPDNRIKGRSDQKEKWENEHKISSGDIPLLRLATIYGANASGKSNFINAIRFAKDVITHKLPIDCIRKFCRVKKENINKPTKFEFELYKNNRYYAYGFSLNISKPEITEEWLYELVPNGSDQIMLFERETKNKTLKIGSDVNLSEIDEMRIKTYKIDFEENRNTLFIKEMNRNKKISNDSNLIFFKDVYDWFKDDLITIFPDQPVTDFEYFYGNEKDSLKINNLIDIFDTGISKVKIEKVNFADFKEKIPKSILKRIMESFNNEFEESEDVSQVHMSMRAKDVFYNIKGKKGEEPVITTIMMEHGDSFSDFEFSEESDGTQRLFDLLDILMNNDKNKIYIIDEMERSLHPKLTYKFIELFFRLLKENNVQLIFTTHESSIMDQDLLRRDEIWFVERNNENISHLYSLDRFKERYDRNISKSYLEGRYGAIPIFKNFSCKVCDVE